MKKVLVFAALLLTNFAQAQEALKVGFQLLESGKFAEGAAFFKNYLGTQDSTNRTALLCYGRGTGLSGHVKEAQAVFTSLLKRYPNDFEISLNAAEALMWGQEYPAAKAYYEHLLTIQPRDFAATLGYANALASLFEYEKALQYTNLALEIQPHNANAAVSRKYARLGLANQLAQKQAYSQALPLLEAILSENPQDEESLFAKAQLLIQMEQLAEADKVYQLLSQSARRQTDLYLGLSYLSFLQKNKSAAIEYANKAIETAKSSPENTLKAKLGRITALGWNEQFKQAFAELDELERQFPNNNEILLKRAGLSVWNKSFGASVALFKQSLKQVPNSFDGNLGCADALFAQELDEEAKIFALRTLRYYPHQKDAEAFLERLSLRHAPSLTTHNFMSSDKGGNVSRNYQLNLGIDLLMPLRLTLGYKRREINNDLEKNAAQTQTLSAGLRWRVHPAVLLTGSVSRASLQKDSLSTPFMLYDVAGELKIGKYQSLELRYRTDVQNFTAGLVGNQLSFKDYIATYNLASPFKVGVYSQYYYTQNSDGNVRNLLFASLYYDVLASPVLKFGVNYQRMTFEKRMSRIYFSPFLFRGYEVFGAFENLNVPKQKWLYQLSGAVGLQRIEDESAQSTYRFSAMVGYRPFAALEVMAYTSYSNSATSSVVGYSYSETGLKAKWIVLKK
ncbi:MAG: hypothetical protein U0Y10_23975 [Spirosomataceae bacterium]